MIDLTKKYRTRDGREVTDLRLDPHEDTDPVHGRVGDTEHWWYPDGTWLGDREHSLDLIEVTEEPVREFPHNTFYDRIDLPPQLTLPTDSAERKNVPLHSGCYAYFPAALAGVAIHSKLSNGKHNPGQPMHHARGKSGDHEDCIARHMSDLADLRAAVARGADTQAVAAAILSEVRALTWRALALSQELHEKYDGAPLAPGAKL